MLGKKNKGRQGGSSAELKAAVLLSCCMAYRKGQVCLKREHEKQFFSWKQPAVVLEVSRLHCFRG